MRFHKFCPLQNDTLNQSNACSSSSGNSGGGGGGTVFESDVFRIVDPLDNTKQFAVDLTAVATGTTKTVTMPNQDIDLTPTTGSFASAAHEADVGNPHNTSDANLVVTDVTTNNTSTSAHGFAPKLSGNTTQYLNGDGNWATPSGVASSYLTQSYTATDTIVVTHNFSTQPVVQVFNNVGVVITPSSITHDSVNQFTVVLGASGTGTVVATVGSPQANNFIEVAGNYTVTADDYFVKATGIASTITLADATAGTGVKVVIKNTSAGGINIDTSGVQTIDGNLTFLLTAGEALQVFSDGSNWLIY